MGNELVVVSGREEGLAALDDRERYALEYFGQQKQYEVARDMAQGMYLLFLRGGTMDDIRKQYPSLSLGQIVHARVRDEWDRRRREHDERLMRETQQLALRSSLEAVNYVCKTLGTIHSLDEEKLNRALLSGSAEGLKELLGGSKTYKEWVDLLQKLTGQSQKPIRGEFTHRHEPGGVLGASAPAGGGSQDRVPGTPLTEAQAAAVLEALYEEGT